MQATSAKLNEFKGKRVKTVDSDEEAHNELPHQDQCCLQIQLFLFLALSVKMKYEKPYSY